jgi:hypothetical protein
MYSRRAGGGRRDGARGERLGVSFRVREPAGTSRCAPIPSRLSECGGTKLARTRRRCSSRSASPARSDMCTHACNNSPPPRVRVYCCTNGKLSPQHKIWKLSAKVLKTARTAMEAKYGLAGGAAAALDEAHTVIPHHCHLLSRWPDMDSSWNENGLGRNDGTVLVLGGAAAAAAGGGCWPRRRPPRGETAA